MSVLTTPKLRLEEILSRVEEFYEAVADSVDEEFIDEAAKIEKAKTRIHYHANEDFDTGYLERPYALIISRPNFERQGAGCITLFHRNGDLKLTLVADATNVDDHQASYLAFVNWVGEIALGIINEANNESADPETNWPITGLKMEQDAMRVLLPNRQPINEADSIAHDFWEIDIDMTYGI